MAKQKKVEKQGMDLVLDGLEKKYGLGRLVPEDLTIVSTGSLQLNQALGVGGTAVGKFVEIFGENSSGKSTLTLHQMAEYQQAFPDKKVALFDYEYAFDRKYATTLGVNVNDLLIYQPETQEEGYVTNASFHNRYKTYRAFSYSQCIGMFTENGSVCSIWKVSS